MALIIIDNPTRGNLCWWDVIQFILMDVKCSTGEIKIGQLETAMFFLFLNSLNIDKCVGDLSFETTVNDSN